MADTHSGAGYEAVPTEERRERPPETGKIRHRPQTALDGLREMIVGYGGVVYGWVRILVVLTVLAGCGAQHQGNAAPTPRERVPMADPEEPIAVAGDDPRIYVNQTGLWMQAGTPPSRLAYRSDGKCLVLVTDEGRTLVPAWPPGSRPISEGGRRGVDAPGIGRVFDGDRIPDVGGGYWAADRPELAGVMVPKSCRSSAFWVF
ncbi:hypothetical protein Aph01nite_45550 [Acrocarpospora phusangensis]|uniref:Uncharacterized protein n=1 Tax=Acrocarpospora phusangensis TaxID=1070424 RepID=A0A919QGV9_9ACTN|nr:hypothetical protein Aph01nite_45550 [Acrocarpospora phusangensis]